MPNEALIKHIKEQGSKPLLKDEIIDDFEAELFASRIRPILMDIMQEREEVNA